jgi:hypothetical protein
MAVAEGDLKNYARDNGPCENEHFAVTVTQKKRTWYDVDVILERCPFVKGIPGVVVQSIDKAKVEALAKADAIPADVKEAAMRAEILTPAVSIKAKG